MKRFYGKQNGSILICSLIVAFLYLTVIDWEYRGTSLHNVLYIVTRYMEYQSILLGIAGMIVSWHYFCLIKKSRKVNFYILFRLRGHLSGKLNGLPLMEQSRVPGRLL